MSIFKAVTNTNFGNTLATLPEKISYLVNPEKAKPDTIWIKVGIALIRTEISMFYEAVSFNQNKYGKPNLKAYDHYILRFDGNKDTHVRFENIISVITTLSCRFNINRFGHYFVLAVMHYDTRVPHVHFLIDTIDHYTGKRRNLTPKDFYSLRLLINQTLQQYGLTPLKFKSNPPQA